MNRKTEIIDEVHKGCICYSVNIVTVIFPYDNLIKTEPECFHVALGIEVEVPVITHNLTDMIENIIHILGGLLQGTGVEESTCLVYVCSRFGEHITERIGIVSCKEVEAVQAVIVKPFQYLTEYSTPAVDSSDKLICELFIVKKIAPEGYYLSEAFGGKTIAVKESNKGQHLINLYFRQFRIGQIDIDKRVFTFKKAYLIENDPRFAEAKHKK